MSFSNKVVLVTGASSGIGAATAIEFAKEGANVVIVGRNKEKLNGVADQIEKIGPKSLIIKTDITENEDAKHLIEEVINTFGKLDVLVNNAGLTTFGSILNGTILNAYDYIMNVNIRAHIQVITLATPHLIKTKGNIVNISSIAANILPENPMMTSYYVSKAALNHFTRCAANELASKGVRVNTVSPGPTKTDFLENAGINHMEIEDYSERSPLKRVLEPVEVARIITFIASNKAMGITGSEYVIDNGWSIKS